MVVLNFEFLTIFNLFIVILWPATGTYTGARSNILPTIMVILTVIVAILDILFLGNRLIHG